MSNRFEISSINKGLFNRNVLSQYVTDEHRQLARSIKRHFENEKFKNPYNLSLKQLSSLSEDDTIDYYIKPILENLGFKYRKKLKDLKSKFPDVWLFVDEPEEANSEYLQKFNLTVLEAKKYRIDLDFGDKREELPPEQILGYVETNIKFNPLKKWGILSNGYKWRLYSSDGPDKYIEFDIDHALENQDELELFCLVFNPESFKINKNRTDFLSKLKTESLNSWVVITKEIEERGDEVLLNLVNGYVEAGSQLDTAKQFAYDTLFKLLYMLYIESKHLIPKGSLAYYNKSLRVLLHDIHDTTLSEYEISKRLVDLFKLFKNGHGILPACFGGEHFEKFPNVHAKNKWFRNALDLLTVFSHEGADVKFFDYSSLNVELIGNIYESTLGLIFQLKSGKVIVEQIEKRTGTEVHSTGTTYTPPNVVKYLISEALPEKIKKLPTICDPSCGSGHFLVQALRHLSKATNFKLTKSENIQQHKQHIALKCLYGTDINPLASILTRLMLVIETSEKGVPAADFRKNILSFNALVMKWKNSDAWLAKFRKRKIIDAGGFDYIVGNPPYVRADEPGESDKRKDIVNCKQYEFLFKKWDLFIPFVELAVGLTKKTKGIVAYVVSDGITYAPYSEKCTEHLSSLKCVRFVSHFSKKFDGWAFPATCFVLDQGKSHSLTERRNHEENRPEIILSTEKTKNAFSSMEKEKISDRLEHWSGLRLGDCFYISVGMVLNSDEKQDKVNFEKDELIIEGKPDKSHPVRYVDNEDIGYGEIIDARKKRFIEYGPGLRAPEYIRRPTFPELHSGQRLFLSRSKKGNAAVLINDDIVVSDNTIVLKNWTNLIGIDNRSISCKARISNLSSKIKIPKGVSERVFLEEISKYCSEGLILGIFLSDFFKKWINEDKRHKHVIVPDVISELPLPIGINFEKNFDSQKYDLTFQTRFENLGRGTPEKTQAEIIYHIEKIVAQLAGKNLESKGNLSKKIFLNGLVKLLFRPVYSKSMSREFNIDFIVQKVLSQYLTTHKELVERLDQPSKARKVPKEKTG